jgi:hypothetical protein
METSTMWIASMVCFLIGLAFALGHRDKLELIAKPGTWRYTPLLLACALAADLPEFFGPF